MTPRLPKMPYEILSAVLEYVTFEDVINLAHTSKGFRFLLEEERICKKVLNVSVAGCWMLGYCLLQIVSK
jgi:hypothetical protein